MAITVDFIGRRINDCDSNTNWAVYRLVGAGGGTWSSTANVDIEDFVQGNSSLNALGAANNNNNKPHAIMYDYNTASGVALNWTAGGNEHNQLVWLWAKVSSPVSTSQDMPGLGICLSSAATSPVATDSAIWNVYKAETYPGGWVRLLCDPSNTTPTASGASFALNSVNFIGVAGATTITRQTNLLWIDAVDIGSGIYVYGNSDSEDVINEISTISESGTNKWGALETLEETDTAYLSRGVLHFGDYQSTNATNITGTNSVVIVDQPTHTTTYTTLTSINSLDDNFPKIVCQGNTSATTNISFGVAVGSADELNGRNGVTFIGNDFYNVDFRFNDGNIDVLNFYGVTLRNFKPTGNLVWNVESNHNLAGAVIDACTRLEPDSGVFIRNTTFLNHVSQSVIDSGALLFTSNPPDDQVIDIKNCSFIANDRGIQHESSGTFTYDGFSFSDNTFDVFFSTGTASDLVVNVTNPVTPAASITATTGAAGSTVSFLSSFTLTITGFKNGSELFMRDATDGTQNIIERFNEESGVGSYEYTYDDALSLVDLFVLKATGDPNAPDENDRPYQWLSFRDFSLPSASQQLLVQQVLDRNYSN